MHEFNIVQILEVYTCTELLISLHLSKTRGDAVEEKQLNTVCLRGRYSSAYIITKGKVVLCLELTVLLHLERSVDFLCAAGGCNSSCDCSTVSGNAVVTSSPSSCISLLTKMVWTQYSSQNLM